MNTSTQAVVSGRRGLHPLVAVAAVSLIVFCLIGIAAITGVLPTSNSKSVEQEPAVKAALNAPTKPADVPLPATTAANATDTPANAPVKEEPAPKSEAPKAPPKHVTQPKPVRVAAGPSPAPVAPPAPVTAPEPMPAPPAPIAQAPQPPVCQDCGTVRSVQPIEVKGEGSGVGAVAGGVLGGVLGHQVGGGRGKDVATVLGAIGGGVAGHEIEKNAKKRMTYKITVELDNGAIRDFNQPTQPSWRPGDRVRVVNGGITSM